MAEILSYGGGTQTAAMCVLVATGRLPKPDAIIAADTGREMPTTWQYADTYMRPLLATVGLELHVAPHTLATVDTYAHNGDLLLPAYTPTGKLPTFCSTEWKARVVERYARRVLNLAGNLTMWIGFSQEERRRVKGHDGRRYPLLDLMLTKADCERIITDAGLPLPSKSRCYMCPHQHNNEWRQVRDQFPHLWEDAIALDSDIRAADDRDADTRHRDRLPLGEANLNDPTTEQVEARQCGLGLCFV